MPAVKVYGHKNRKNVGVLKTFGILRRLSFKVLLQRRKTNTLPDLGGRGSQIKGYGYSCYVHCNAIPAQTPLLFNLLSFRNGLALCSGRLGSYSCSASVRLDGAAVRKSALPSDWKSMLRISCLCSSAWRSCSVYRGFSGSLGPAAVLRHGIGAVGPLRRCQPASLAALHNERTRTWSRYGRMTDTSRLVAVLTQTHRNNFHIFQSNSPGSAELNCFEGDEICCFWLQYVLGSLISCYS